MIQVRRAAAAALMAPAMALGGCEGAASGETDPRFLGAWRCIAQHKDSLERGLGYTETLFTSDGRFSAITSMITLQDDHSLVISGVTAGRWRSDGRAYTETVETFDVHYAAQDGAEMTAAARQDVQRSVNQTMLRATPMTVDAVAPDELRMSDEEIAVRCERRKETGENR